MDLSSNTTKKPRARQRGRKKQNESSNAGQLMSFDRGDKTTDFEEGNETPVDLAFKKPTITLRQGCRKDVSTMGGLKSGYGPKTLPLSGAVTPQQSPLQSQSPQTADKKSSKSVADNAVTFVDKLVDEGIERLKKEYTEINKITPTKTEIATFLKPENASKNRNMEVPCIDSTRVQLQNNPSDYIHANFVATPSNPKRFICTQCPTVDTSNDFWLMIAQHDVERIGMISDMSKGNKDDLALYFPNKTNRSFRFGDVKVTCKKREKMTINSELRRTTLTVQYKDKNLTVLHYHWAYFPTKTVPPINGAPFQFLGFLRSSKTPIVLHDCLGTGRVGAFCLIEIFMETLMSGKEVETLQAMTEKLRKSRALAIDSEIIYYYVHSLIIDYLKKKLNFQSSQLFLEFLDSYEAAIKKHEKNLAKQEGKSTP
uniref:Protein-tyrosine phosphatase n=1 Tax=Parastrongyloides trichosuri TaxID=131310 RepID=A0A0N4ZT54_PARTI